MIHDGTTPSFSEFGYFDNDASTGSGTGIGTVGVGYSTVSGGDLELRLTPPANTAIKTKVFQYNLTCLLYTSDAADDLLCVDLGGRSII